MKRATFRAAPAIDRILRDAVAAGVAPGIVAGIADREGVLYEGAAGTRDPRRSPMTLDTVFLVASLTKPVTAVAALQMVDQGRLTLDADAGEIIPYLRDVPVLEGFDAGGRPMLRKAGRPITLRALLSHVSGMTYFSWHPDTARYIEQAELPPLFSCRNDALSTPLGSDPGTQWHYSIGVDWAGKMVEAVTGLTLEDYFQRFIFAPLGMSSSGFVIRPTMREKLAQMYRRAADGGFDIMDLEVPQQPEFFMGGGGLYATVGDYLRLMRMVLNGGVLDGIRVLSAEMTEAMWMNQIGSISVGRMFSTEAGGNDFELFPGSPKRWSLAFMINVEEAPTGRSAGSIGWAGMPNLYCWIDRRRSLAGISLMQFMPFGDPRAIATHMAFETAACHAG